MCFLLFDYITNCLPETVKELLLFPAAVLAKTETILLSFLATLATNWRFSKSFQHLPVRGRSFLSCDRVFELIQKVLQKIDWVY
jgi:hypothetical protein